MLESKILSRRIPFFLLATSLVALLGLSLATVACSSPNGEESPNDVSSDTGQDADAGQDPDADLDAAPDADDGQDSDTGDSLDTGADADTETTTDADPDADADGPEPEDRILEDTDRIFAGYFTKFDDDLMIAGHPHVFDELVDHGHDPAIADEGLLVDVQRIDAESVGDFPWEGDYIEALDEAVQITATELGDDEAISAPVDTAFYTVVSVPGDFDADHLAPAMFIYDWDGDSWWDFEYAQGFYDPSENLYFTETEFIGGSDYPARVVLAEHAERTTEVWDGVFQDIIETYFPDLEQE